MKSVKKVFVTFILLSMIADVLPLFAKSKKKMVAIDEDIQKAMNAEQNWQYFEWDDPYSDNVKRYGLEIQKYDEKTDEWTEILLENSEGELVSYLELNDNSTKIKITPSLVPGEYRYRITPYDLLDRKADASEWFPLEVITAYEPEISSISPSKIYLDEYNDGFIKVSGKNLFLPEPLLENDRKTDYILKANALKTFKIKVIDPEKKL